MDEERTIEQRPAVAWPAEVEYPDSDGLPMAENTVQCRAIREAMGALENHYKPGREVGIASDLLLYYRQGDPATSVAPDLMVSFGVRMLGLPSYKLWEIGKPPEFVLEVSSQSSRELDRTKKVELYAGLGVREYFVFDPGDPEDVGDGQDGKLAGYRLWGRKYVESGESSDRGRELESEELGLLLRPEGKLVRFRDPATGKDLPLHQEESQGRLEAERERDAEMRARQEAERERDEEKRGREEERRARLRLEGSWLRCRASPPRLSGERRFRIRQSRTSRLPRAAHTRRTPAPAASPCSVSMPSLETPPSAISSMAPPAAISQPLSPTARFLTGS